MRPHGSVMKLEIFLPNFGHTIPFVELLGFVLVRMEQGRSELHYEAQAGHLNTFGVTHGGASMTLMDVAMAVATRSLQPDMGCVTIEMKSSFMQPARGPLVARGEVLHRSRSMTYAQAHVYDASGRLCSHATGTFKYMPPARRDSGAESTTLATD